MDLCKKTKILFSLYFTGKSQEDVNTLMKALAPDCVIIGTGQEEFYTGRDAVLGDIQNALREHENLNFCISSIEAEERILSDRFRMVYGRLIVRGSARESLLSVCMDSRFVVVYVLRDGEWLVSSIHQSVPFGGQAPGEYYPRSLYKQMEEIRSAADAMKELAQKDCLTGLYNLRTLQEFFESRREKNTWMLLGDLDNFKRINDLYGHMEGNDVLKRVAAALRRSVRSQDLVARIGGDEFTLLCHNIEREQVERVLCRILSEIQRIRADVAKEDHISLDFGISLGAVEVRQEETLSDAIHRADTLMYEAKRSGKNQYCIEK